MALSAVLFTTTGAGASLTSTRPGAHASEEARESTYRTWAEDDRRRTGDDSGYDPSSPERVRDGLPPREEAAGPDRRPAPYTQDEADEEFADNTASQ